MDHAQPLKIGLITFLASMMNRRAQTNIMVQLYNCLMHDIELTDILLD